MYLSIHSIHNEYLQQTTKKLQDPLRTKTLPLGTIGHPWGSSVLRQNGVLSLVALAFPRCEQRISRSWATAAEWDHVSQSSVTWFQNNKGQEEFFFRSCGGSFFCVWIVFGCFWCFPTRKKNQEFLVKSCFFVAFRRKTWTFGWWQGRMDFAASRS